MTNTFGLPPTIAVRPGAKRRERERESFEWEQLLAYPFQYQLELFPE